MRLDQHTSERYLVLGGAGFLGSHIVEALIGRGEPSVASFSQSPPADDDAIAGASYYTGDILDEEVLKDCLKRVTPTVVFHTVSPSVRNKGLKETAYYDVNVDGTKLVLNTCREMGVKVFVYTSSTSVVWSGQRLSGPNELEIKIPDKPFTIYAHSKGLAETMVLRENGVRGMKTVALRPPGMIGRRDRLSMWRLTQAYEKGQHKYQMGDNTNLVDYSYVGNIADAHVLAADRLTAASISQTSVDGVSGQAFFLSDGKPRPYWDFPRLVWKLLGDDGKNVVVLPRWLCFIVAFFAEFLSNFSGKAPTFSRFAVAYSTTEQWYNIDKARRLLGYEPRVPLEEGIAIMVDWWKAQGAKQYTEKMEAKKSR